MGMFSKQESQMEEFKTWEEMSDLEQAQCQYWDMYKDAYGVRPRGIDTSTWTLEDFHTEFASLDAVIVREEINRKIAQHEACHAFEMRMLSVLACGAKDREMALRWIHEAEGTQGDDEFLCWTLGLPYQYFRKVA
jgi:hypothetical protein